MIRDANLKKARPWLLMTLACLTLSLALVLEVHTAMGQEAQASAPGLVILDAIDGPYGAVNFDHEMHTAMAEGCADCHHNHGSDNTRCSGCHEIGAEQFKGSVHSGFMACNNCHGEIDADEPGMPSLKVALHTTCFGCHKEMGSLGKSPAGCTEQCHVSTGQ